MLQCVSNLSMGNGGKMDEICGAVDDVCANSGARIDFSDRNSCDIKDNERVVQAILKFRDLGNGRIIMQNGHIQRLYFVYPNFLAKLHPFLIRTPFLLPSLDVTISPRFKPKNVFKGFLYIYDIYHRNIKIK